MQRFKATTPLAMAGAVQPTLFHASISALLHSSIFVLHRQSPTSLVQITSPLMRNLIFSSEQDVERVAQPD